MLQSVIVAFIMIKCVDSCRILDKSLHLSSLSISWQFRFASMQYLAFPKAKIAIRTPWTRLRRMWWDRWWWSIPKENCVDYFEKQKGYLELDMWVRHQEDFVLRGTKIPLSKVVFFFSSFLLFSILLDTFRTKLISS